MKAQCERCKEIVPLEFVPVDGGIEVTCPSCAEAYVVAAKGAGEPAKAADAGPPMSDPPGKVPPTGAGSVQRAPIAGMTCPKCGEPQPRADACRRCGLLVDRWRGPVAAADVSTPTLDDAREAAALWTEVEARWDDPARHDAFLAFCRKTTAFAFAASRYRAAIPRHADAEHRLKQVRTMAELALRRPGPGAAAAQTRYRGTVIVIIVLVLLLVAGATYVLFLRGTAKPRRPPADPPPPTLPR